MRVIDIKSDMPLVKEALERLEEEIAYFRGSEKAIKVLHGYGSTGEGGAIKKATREVLKAMKKMKKIREYIPGEGFSLQSGFAETIDKYKHLLKGDSDYGKGNDGITYVIF